MLPNTGGGWSEHRDDATDNVYFFNERTKLSRWDCPLEFSRYKESTKKPEPVFVPAVTDIWDELRDLSTNKCYYYNKITRETCWDAPEGFYADTAAVKLTDEIEKEKATEAKAPAKAFSPPAGNPIAVFDTTMGTFEAEILLDTVPRTASNFIDLVKRGFYNGLHFHRVIPGFMTQFGCPFSANPADSRAGSGGPKDGDFLNLWTGETEVRQNGGCIVDEHIHRTSNTKGTLAVANTGEENSGGSQFFINVADNHALDWFSAGPSQHTVFGRLLDKDSYDLNIAISAVKTVKETPFIPVMVECITLRAGPTKPAAQKKRPAETTTSAADDASSSSPADKEPPTKKSH